jgi:Protein of unknown function (DUF2934)
MKTPKQKLKVSHKNSTGVASLPSPNFEDQVRARAYIIYRAKGSASGSALDDWLEAERELKQGLSR